ncbi:CsbD family protein [Pseudomarimonas salicorniae]|uniref:CsbD family protein n=1 Tax=Pseudomarimonas salicorniae TaxID=2933270 RepID=A0ABT0GES9_9GAMM|nr:CsbD family protein [Lysobacter sp. CAU 1642]MCK7593059.1 CsbD family protein [Lysobacter sp. CAU 1642]
MNWDIVKGNWKQFQGQVRAQWGKLTDDQLGVIDGRRVELAGKIQETYGISREEAEKQIAEFEKRQAEKN